MHRAFFLSICENLNAHLRNTGRAELTPNEVIAQITAYRDGPGTGRPASDEDKPLPFVDDGYLRNYYPRDLKNWLSKDINQSPGRDLLLSFFEDRYPDFQDDKLDELSEWFRAKADSAPKRRSRTRLESVLALEQARRNAGSSARAHKPFWDATSARIREKYQGIYLLVRKSSDDRVVLEPFCLCQDPDTNQLISAFWLCDGDHWDGDLHTSSFKFSGITARRSTNKVIEPVTISILRNVSRKDGLGRGVRLVLSGMVTGWVDHDQQALIFERVALLQLARIPNHKAAKDAFERFARDYQKDAPRGDPNQLYNWVLEQPADHLRRTMNYLTASDAILTPSAADQALRFDLSPEFMTYAADRIWPDEPATV